MYYNLDQTIKMNNELIYTNKVDECMVVCYGDQLYCLNETATELWVTCDGRTVAETICDFIDKLEKPFSTYEVLKDCLEIMNEWIEIGLVWIDDGV